jgi:mitogen-activated protein kinase kinase kinase 17/18
LPSFVYKRSQLTHIKGRLTIPPQAAKQTKKKTTKNIAKKTERKKQRQKPMAASGRWRRLRTLGRGASGAVVSLASDAASGELFAVKSAGASGAATLRREHAVLRGLRSPHVVRCVGGGEGADGSYQVFLEYAPGGSVADAVARGGGALEERAIRALAADVLRGLAYLHGRSVVHGDVKARNVLLGADGRARLADFGCARTPGFSAQRPLGGTPAFMAPEVARGEAQGPAADVWALGCTVVEMATGRAPWGGADADVLAAVHRIGYTDAVPDAPSWMSAEARDFLARCFARDAAERWTAAQLLEHPFVAAPCHGHGDHEAPRVSPKSTLDAAFWEAEDDDDDADEAVSASASERIKSLACSACALPDWDGEDGWIEVLGDQQRVEVCGAVQVARSAPGKVSSVLAVPAGEMDVGGGGGLPCDELEAEDVSFGGEVPGAADASAERQKKRYLILRSHYCHVLSCQLVPCNLPLVVVNNAIKLWVPTNVFFVLCCRSVRFPLS